MSRWEFGATNALKAHPYGDGISDIRLARMSPAGRDVSVAPEHTQHFHVPLRLTSHGCSRETSAFPALD